ncbi:MAG: hypothetical protein C7B46_19000 [Sulfobacillus benefaciens]|uniref:Uncharacterized protein n=1 Tax=Sulfobacillus benefaciens TaxID=453960 RepID=A0A2T2X2C6_9FIRM|nr:MAG: hypothetical protein C7B46_19000 [Sulfobacillus benefaciens]
MYINEEECAHAGFDAEQVAQIKKLGRRLERLAHACDALGIIIFGGSGAATLRFDDGHRRPLILAHLSTINVDGGDGSCAPAEDGYERGE